MKKLGIIIKYFLFLVVIVMSVFYFFGPDDLLIGEEMARALIEELKPNESPPMVIPKGVNYDTFNIISLMIHGIVTWDLLRKSSILQKAFTIGLSILDPQKIQSILLAISVISLLFLGITLYSIQDNLPHFFGTVEWTVRTNSGAFGPSMNVWSTGQSFILKEIVRVVCYFVIFRLSNKLRKGH